VESKNCGEFRHDSSAFAKQKEKGVEKIASQRPFFVIVG